jgi:hypothetical protein
MSDIQLKIKTNTVRFSENPFKLSVEKVPNDCQDEFLEQKTDSGARDMCNEKSSTEVWPLMCNSYLKVAERAIHAFLPFVSTLLQMKTKQ